MYTDQRAELKQIIRAKRSMLDMYVTEIERLEAKAANLRGAAESIEAGIVKAEAQLRKLKQNGDTK